MKQGKLELVIQVPATAESQEALVGQMQGDVISQRDKAVRAMLQKRCIDEAQKEGVITNEEVTDIPQTELKEQPRQMARTSMADFIQTHDKQKVYKQALEREEATTKVPAPMQSDGTSSEHSDSSEEAARRANKFGVKTGISQATVQAIQFKQKAENEQKQKTSDLLEQQDSQKNVETLLKISEQIKSIFQFELSTKKFLGKVLETMMQGNMRGNFVSKGKFFS